MKETHKYKAEGLAAEIETEHFSDHATMRIVAWEGNPLERNTEQSDAWIKEIEDKLLLKTEFVFMVSPDGFAVTLTTRTGYYALRYPIPHSPNICAVLMAFKEGLENFIKDNQGKQ